MSSINELNNNIVTSGLTTQNSTNVSANNPTENTNEDFDSVMLQALKNCNGQRPEHVCCCGNSHVEEGVEEIDCLNKPFDPNLEQAIMTEKVEGVESGIVIEVLQKGYVLKDRILRPAMVKVSE